MAMYDRYRREDRSAFRYLLCFSESRFSIPAPVKRRRRARFFRKVVAQSYPIRIVIQFSRYSMKGLHLFPPGNDKCKSKSEKHLRVAYFEKTSSLIWTKGAEMHTHFRDFPRKNFIRRKIPSLIWNWEAKTHPVFKKKFWKKTKKYARHCWQAYFLYLKSCLFHINLQKSLILDEH